MSEGMESEILTASIPRNLFDRLRAETTRTAERLMLRPDRARSMVVRLALAAYLNRAEAEAESAEQKPAA